MHTKVAPSVTPFPCKSKEVTKPSQKGRGTSENYSHIYTTE